MNPIGELWLLTGERNSGKTKLLQQVATYYQEKLNINAIEGLLSPGVFEGNRKVAIDLMDIRTGERRRLAGLKQGTSHSLSTKHWAFDQKTINWGNERLYQMSPAPLFIIDEVGPLELERKDGLVAAVNRLDSPTFDLGIVVVRPSLLHKAKDRWQPNAIVDLQDYKQGSAATDHLISKIETFIAEKGHQIMKKELRDNVGIAFVSDDGETISSHFGRAQQYAVITLEQGNIVKRELRPKFSPHASSQGHQHGTHAPDERHQRMVEPILDCQLVIARGMGQGAQSHLERAGIDILLTNLNTIDEAIQAYLEGKLAHQPDRLHRGHSHRHNEEGDSGPERP